MSHSLVALMLLVGCAHEGPEPTRRPPRQPVSTVSAPAAAPRPAATGLSPLATSLSQIEMFAIGGVGFAGATSRGEELALALAREPDAIAMFDKLIVHPNRAARLYAYWALKTLDPTRAQQHQRALASDATEIETMHGCIGTRQPTHELAAEIDKYPQLAMPAP